MFFIKSKAGCLVKKEFRTGILDIKGKLMIKYKSIKTYKRIFLLRNVQIEKYKTIEQKEAEIK